MNLFELGLPSMLCSEDDTWTYNELSLNGSACVFRTVSVRDNTVSLNSDSDGTGSTNAITGSIAEGTGSMSTRNPSHNVTVNLNAKDSDGDSAVKWTTFSMPYATNTGDNFYMRLHNEQLPYLDLRKLTGTLKYDAFTAASTLSLDSRGFTIPRQSHTYSVDTTTTGTIGSKQSVTFDRMLFCNATILRYGTDTSLTYIGFKFVTDFKAGQKFQNLGRTRTVYLSDGNWQEPDNIFTPASHYLDDWHIYVVDDSQAVELTIGDDGMYTSPIDGKALILTYCCHLPQSRIENVGATKFYIATPALFKIDMLPTTETRNQTEELKDTTGSETILNGVVNQNQSLINQKLGFIAQTGEIVGGTYDAFMNSDATGSITFPGVAWEGQTIIAAQQVPIIPSGFEGLAETIRTFNTGVLALLWVRGVRHLYGRIFLNETDVIVDDE